jgi:hypothetical protein
VASRFLIIQNAFAAHDVTIPLSEKALVWMRRHHCVKCAMQRPMHHNVTGVKSQSTVPHPTVKNVLSRMAIDTMPNASDVSGVTKIFHLLMTDLFELVKAFIAGNMHKIQLLQHQTVLYLPRLHYHQ